MEMIKSRTGRRGWVFWVGLALIGLLQIPFGAAAQERDETLSLSIHKRFGFGMGDRIQGRFVIKVDEPDDLEQVTFLLDDEPIFVDSAPPFQMDFSTGAYAAGRHRLAAIGRTVDGRTLSSEIYSYSFLSADEAMGQVTRVLVPLGALVLLFTLLGNLVPLLLDKQGRRFRLGRYGAAGGAVCPNCSLPFSRKVLSLKLLLRKFERCPHCGRWAWVGRGSHAELKGAEGRYLAEQKQAGFQAGEDEAARMKRLLEDSRFEE
jgi:hypothetical protein